MIPSGNKVFRAPELRRRYQIPFKRLHPRPPLPFLSPHHPSSERNTVVQLHSQHDFQQTSITCKMSFPMAKSIYSISSTSFFRFDPVGVEEDQDFVLSERKREGLHRDSSTAELPQTHSTPLRCRRCQRHKGRKKKVSANSQNEC